MEGRGARQMPVGEDSREDRRRRLDTMAQGSDERRRQALLAEGSHESYGYQSFGASTRRAVPPTLSNTAAAGRATSKEGSSSLSHRFREPSPDPEVRLRLRG